MSDSLAARLALWGVDRPAPYEGMLLDFIEHLAQNQPYPSPAKDFNELQARREKLQLEVRHSLGLEPWPEKTPLKPRIVGRLERDSYSIDKLIFESWPSLEVTAHLYLPKGRKTPIPGLVYAPGHWMESGKLAPPIQSFCAMAASLGIAVLVYDPIGQGERLGSWRDHAHLNALLVDASQLGLMVWESIRALDYLLSRPEIDQNKVGITGASGGGLNTLFAAAVEDRFACAIPAAYPCVFFLAMQAERDLNWEDATDVCNQVPRVMSYAEMSDLASLFIPRPYMILSGTRDKIFPIAGARRIAQAVVRNYELAGKPERFRFVERDEAHGYQKCLREAAYGWLSLWLLEEGDGSPISEREFELLPDPYPVAYLAPPELAKADVREQSPTLAPMAASLPGFCLPPEQPIRSEKIIDELLAKRAGKIEYLEKIPDKPEEFPGWQAAVKERIKKVLGPFPDKGDLHTRLFNQVWQNGLLAERITFESEPGITVPGLFIMPEEWHKAAPFAIYIGEWGKAQGLASGVIERMLGQGYGVLAVDVRGVGETAATDFEAATNALMMDRPLFGQRVYDVLRSLDFLWERCYIGPQIDKGRLFLYGEGMGGLLALYAAALDSRLAGVVADGLPYSYKALLPHGAVFPASAYLFDVLNHFDLEQVAAACAPRPLWYRAVDGRRHPCREQELSTAMEQAVRAYELFPDKPAGLQLKTQSNDEELLTWLRKVLN